MSSRSLLAKWAFILIGAQSYLASGVAARPEAHTQDAWGRPLADVFDEVDFASRPRPVRVSKSQMRSACSPATLPRSAARAADGGRTQENCEYCYFQPQLQVL
jgi:hypothetical protein